MFLFTSTNRRERERGGEEEGGGPKGEVDKRWERVEGSSSGTESERGG